jgi:hypothetical protein
VGIDLTKVPRFRLLTENSTASSFYQSALYPAVSAATRFTSPVLRIEIAVADNHRVNPMGLQNLITTIEGLQSIIDTIWNFDDGLNPHAPDEIYHKDLSLTLNYKLKAASRSHSMSELVLKPWNWIHGPKEIVLQGDIEERMRELLKKSNLEGPFPNDVATQLAGYRSLAEQEFKRKDYSAARWWCNLSDDYWDYILFLDHSSGGRNRRWQRNDEIWNVMMELPPIFYEMRLKLVVACLRQSKYDTAISIDEDAIPGNIDFEGYPGPSPIMKTKFLLSSFLAHTALTWIVRGERALGMASRT